MKIALIGDIHGNLLALTAVLRSSYSFGVEKYLFSGDAIGYYYQPREVLECLTSIKAIAVKGNHEDLLEKVISDKAEAEALRRKYGSGFDQAAADLSDDQLNYLRFLPRSIELEIEGKRVLLCHGAPWSTDHYIYPDAPPEDWERLDRYGADFIVLGHTHYQFDRKLANAHVINPGSVGQPRDRKPGAAWTMLDLSTGIVQHFRERYDVNGVALMARERDPDLSYLYTVLSRK